MVEKGTKAMYEKRKPFNNRKKIVSETVFAVVRLLKGINYFSDGQGFLMAKFIINRIEKKKP